MNFKKYIIIFKKRKGKYFYTFNHFYSEESSEIAQIYYYDPQSAGINMESPQSELTSRRLTLGYSLRMRSVAHGSITSFL